MVSTTKDGRAAPRQGEVRPVVTLLLVCGHVENVPMAAAVERPAFSWCGRCGVVQVVVGLVLPALPGVSFYAEARAGSSDQPMTLNGMPAR